MAKDIRNDDTDECDVITARLVEECAREEESCLYTSTAFYIWLRWLKGFRAALWVGAAVGSGLAASHILQGDPAFKVTMAFAALAGVCCRALAARSSLMRQFRITLLPQVASKTCRENCVGLRKPGR